MSTNRQFSLALEALVELKADNAVSATQPKPVPATPTLNGVLSEIGSMPREGLFLGIASDGLPVLLNLHDSTPGPILITGDAGSGKTAFLRTIARAVQQTHRSENVQFGVITDRPDEWDTVPKTDHFVGVFSVHHNSAQDFLLSLAGWAHANKSRQSVLLFIDDLESVTKLDADALQNLRWLLLRGPARRVWPMITLNAERYGQVVSWIQTFRTRIFGRIEKTNNVFAVGGDEASALDRLEAGMQFALREKGNWLRFWLPSC